MRRPTTLRGTLATASVMVVAAVAIATLLGGYSATPVIEAVQVLAVVGLGVVVIGGAIVLALVRLADWRTPEDEFERIVQRAESLASEEPWTYDEHDDEPELDYWADDEEHFDLSDEEDFKALVHSAVDELPLEFHRALEHVAIVVADSPGKIHSGLGRRGVYGLYEGDSVTQDYFRDRIVIFRDRLLRDFGNDPDRLRGQVLRTVRKELSEHHGWDGNGVSRS